MTRTLGLDEVNRMSPEEFRDAFGGVFERSPWVAERMRDARPFRDVDELHAAMVAAVRRASPADQIALLRAHPDLAGKAARAGTMTSSSVAEQSSAGLDRLTDEEYARFERLNAAYRQTFGFPFIIAVRRRTKASILDAFERRLQNTVEQEIEAALAEVFDITRMRLDGLVKG